MTETEQVLAALNITATTLAHLQHEPAIVLAIQETAARRDQLIKDALALGIPERTIAASANVTRGWIWKVKSV